MITNNEALNIAMTICKTIAEDKDAKLDERMHAVELLFGYGMTETKRDPNAGKTYWCPKCQAYCAPQEEVNMKVINEKAEPQNANG